MKTNKNFWIAGLMIFFFAAGTALAKMPGMKEAKESPAPDASAAASPSPEAVKVKEGIIKTLYPNQRTESEQSYHKDKLDGVSTWYYETGAKKIESNYKDGFAEGNTKVYFPNGKVRAEAFLIHGKIAGEEKRYYESGQLARQTTYGVGDLSGPFKTFYENGKPECEGKAEKGHVRPGFKCLDEKGNINANMSPQMLMQKLSSNEN